MAIWDDVLTDRDREVYAKAGYGRSGGLGRRPAVMVVDMTYGFTGDRPEPILQAVERYPNSSGEEGWDAIRATVELLASARAAGVPVIYTRGDFSPSGKNAGKWLAKMGRMLEKPAGAPDPDEIVAEIKPAPEDLVIVKDKPSAFFGTALMSHLNEMDVDTLLVVGGTTSGCVRASVIDAFSYNFTVAVVEEGCFDRGQVSHKINLFDMAQKYADVIPLAQAQRYLAGLAPARAAE